MDSAGVQPLTICAVGVGSSTHTATRLRWFAERGHRVFLLTTSPSPSGIAGVTQVDLNAESLLLGEARVLELLRRQLERVRRPSQRKAKHEATPRPPTASAAEDDPVTVARRRLRGPLLLVVHRALMAAALLLAFRRYRPDVVHVHFAYDYYAWLVGLFGTRPLVVTVLGGDVLFEEQGSPTADGKWLTARLLRQADYITTQSNFLADAVNRLGDFRGKTERILWGISLERFRRRDASALRVALGLRPEARVILSAKILQPFYRVHLVVESMAIVRRHCPDVVLVVTEYEADPEYRERLARRVAELELEDHVRFAGVVPDDDVPTYYSLAELSIAIPPSDGLPQALLESLACETPQILTRLPRYEELVHHEDGAYFVDPEPESIAAGIVRLFEDEDLRTTIAARGRQIVAAEANLEEQAARVELRYRELVATTRPRALRLSALLSAVPAYLSSRRGG